MQRVPIVDSLKDPPGFVSSNPPNWKNYLSDFLVTDLELDGLDLGPLIHYAEEILYDGV